MQFLRDNIFLIGVLAALVVVGGIFILVASIASNDVDEALDQRAAVASSLSAVLVKPVNEAVVAAEKQRVSAIRSAAEQAEEICVQWNRRNYDVFVLKTSDGQVKAFPVDEQVYERHGLRFKFPREYNRKLSELVARLSPAKVPTEQELEDELERRLQVLEIEERKAGKDAAAPKAKGVDKRPAFNVLKVAPGKKDESGINARATQEAIDAMKLRGAGSGLTFISLDSLDRYFGEEVLIRPSFQKLWEAQLNYWVTRDILTAIDQTNQQVLRAGQQARKPNVLNAAIKRLVKIDISEGYYWGNASGGSSIRGGGHMASPSVGRGGSLTQHICNKFYDVIRYEFSVIMPTRYLPVLQRNLLKQNFHTILQVEIGPFEDKQKITGTPQKMDLYYYGPEPVVQVTLHGELLLLTEWERGKWDYNTRAWSKKYPPLMPKEALDRIIRDAPGAKRREDTYRQ